LTAIKAQADSAAHCRGRVQQASEVVVVQKIVTWIVVADGARARVFVNEGVGKGVAERLDRAFVGSRRLNQDIQADRPGRAFESAGQARHAMEPRTDPHRHAEREFIREFVDWLAEEVLIAAPQTLGDLRRLLPKPLAAKVTGEIAKDLTRATPAEIEAQIGGILAA
jgi:protein required for attachment to host cells